MGQIAKIFSVYLVISLLITINSLAQEAPIKWGEISRQDLEMKSFPNDTNASAVILCDFGESYFDDDLNLIYTRHLRVKILTSKGFEWGTHSVFIDDEDENISNIEGVTYNLIESGRIEKKELTKKDIFKEKVTGDLVKYKFTLPGIMVGSIIEIKYKIETQNIAQIRDWVFQYSEPVLWSEYRLRNPNNIAYSSVYRGYEHFYINETEETTQVFSGTAVSLLGGRINKCASTRWVIKDAPAIREEPFVTTIDDYYNKVDIQLAGYSFVGIPTKHILGDWKTFVNEMIDYKYFGEKIDDTRKIRKQAEKIIEGLETHEEKIEAIYNWISRSIVWDGENRAFAYEEVNDVLEKKQGNSAEINFLLLSMLKSIGIDGKPIMLSTRGNGRIQTLYPIVNQFNYVLAKVQVGNKTYYLDATDPLRPMNILPVKVLNVKGLVIKKDSPEWVSVSSDKKNIINSFANIYLKEDGSISGNLKDRFYEYAALNIRHKFKERNEENNVVKENFGIEKSDFVADSISILRKDSIQFPLEISISISSPNYANSGADMIYFTPQIIHRLNENPLKAKVRKFPIDYAYRSNLTSEINLFLPNGYEIKEPFKDIILAAAFGGISFSRETKINGNHVKIISKFIVEETEIKPQYYNQVKEFYNKVIAVESQQLVLQKIGNSEKVSSAN